MPLSNSVLRRYTPPTCTLEIAGKVSPLSRWAAQPVLKQVRFQLSFDDPRISDDQQMTIRGDRAQLEALSDAVETYVQQLLDTPADRLDADLSLSSLGADHASRTNTSTATLSLVPPSLAAGASENGAALPGRVSGIRLQPKGLVSHELHLGPLATAESGSTISLSALQLFDLANALSNYATEALALPNLNRPVWMQSSVGWARVAAVLLLAVGITTPIVKFVADVSSPLQTASSTDSAEEFDNEQALSSIPDGDAIPITPLPGTDEPSLDVETIPPPPPAGQTTPPSASDFPSVGVPRLASPRSRPNAGAAPQTAPRSAPQPAPVVPRAPSGGSGTVPQAPVSPIPAPEADLPAIASAPAEPSESDNLSSLSRSAVQNDAARSQPGAAAPPPGSTAFDAIPQVAEVRSYFQERWQPPEELTQTLEYRLIVGADGSVQSIVPLGQAAGNYVDRTQIPLLGEAFVSPLEQGQSAQIRLVLRPDGQVQTFLESVN